MATKVGHTDAIFQAWRLAMAGKVPAYYLMSTAPTDVEQPFVPPVSTEGGVDGARHGASELPPLAEAVPDDEVIEEIAGKLRGHDDPTLVLLIHGFNNDRAGVSRMVEEARTAIASDPIVSKAKNAVFIGCRWPSEAL